MVNLRAKTHALKHGIAQRFGYTCTRMRSSDDEFVIPSAIVEAAVKSILDETETLNYSAASQ